MSAQPAPARTPEPFLPRFQLPPQARAAGWFFLAAVVVFLFASQVHPLADPDVYVHLRDGRYWVENGLHFGPDPFTYSIPGKTIDRIEVLFCVGSYRLWQLGGFNLLILVKAGLLLVTFAGLGLLLYRRWPELGAAGGLLVAGLGLPSFWGSLRERPYVFTYLFLVAFTLALDRYRRAGPADEPRARWPLWGLALLTPLWVNLHPGFIVVFGFLGAQWLEDGAASWTRNDPLALRRGWVVGALILAVAAAGLCNPLGAGIYGYAVQHTGSELFNQYIREWKAPELGAHYDFFILLGAVWLAQLLAWKRARIYDLLTLAVFSYLAVRSVRNFPFFLIAALPPLAGNLWVLWARVFPAGRVPRVWVRRAYLLGGVLTLGLLAAMAGSRTRVLQLGTVKDFYATDAIAWVQKQPTVGRLILPIHWADYLSWQTHGRTRVFMDGRLLLFGEKLFYDYMLMTSGDLPRLLPLLDQNRIELLMVVEDNPEGYFQRLLSGNWVLVYFDHLGYVFARTNGANRAWALDHAYHHIVPWRSSGYYFDTADLPGTLAEAKRAALDAPHSFLPWFIQGQVLMGTGARDSAIQAFEHALALDPKQYPAQFNLGLLLLQAGRPAEARTHMEIAVQHTPAGAQRDQMLGQLDDISGRAR